MSTMTSFMSFFRSKPPTQVDRSLAELSSVTLTRHVDVDGNTLPRGSRGTVVYVYQDGRGFEVEFEQPFHAVVTLERSDLDQ